MNISGLPSGFSSYATPAAVRPVGAGAGEKSAESGGKTVSAGQQGAPEQAEIRKLKARDQEVRQHEQAHLSAAGGLAVSAASFTYQKGPDGVMEQQANLELAQRRTVQTTSDGATTSGGGRSPDVAGYYAGVTNDRQAATISIYA